MKTLLGLLIVFSVLGLVLYFLNSEGIVTTDDWSTLLDYLTSKLTGIKDSL